MRGNDMEFDYRTIQGHDKIVSALGKWPSFHDFEVVSIFLQRDMSENMTGASLEVELYGFRLEVRPDDPARHECLIKLVFRSIEDLRLEGFNHQNAINGITLESRWSDRLACAVLDVRFIGGFGASCQFQCTEMEVLSVHPWKALK